MIAVMKGYSHSCNHQKSQNSPCFDGVGDGHKRVNEANLYDPTMEASQEHLGVQVMEKMVSRKKQTVQQRAFVVVSKEVSSF